MSSAVDNAYQTVAPAGKFPFVVVNVTAGHHRKTDAGVLCICVQTQHITRSVIGRFAVIVVVGIHCTTAGNIGRFAVHFFPGNAGSATHGASAGIDVLLANANFDIGSRSVSACAMPRSLSG